MGLIGRLLVLFAVLLMPLSMAPASSLDHDAMAGITMDHSVDQSSKRHHNDGLATCSMACASALPAQDVARDETFVRRPRLTLAMVRHALHGIHPEIATLPPKLA